MSLDPENFGFISEKTKFAVENPEAFKKARECYLAIIKDALENMSFSELGDCINKIHEEITNEKEDHQRGSKEAQEKD